MKKSTRMFRAIARTLGLRLPNVEVVSVIPPSGR